MQLYAERWWKLKDDELAASVCGTCSALESDASARRSAYELYLSLYEGRPVSIDSDRYFPTAWDSRLDGIDPLYNLIRSACDTAQADIAGRQRPKPLFMTTGADWKTHRRAKKLDKFVEAQLNEPQGCYPDTWALMLDVFHDATKLGTGIAKVWGDVEAKKVRIERVFPWEIFVDSRESRTGNPQNIFHVYEMERDLAIAMFCNVEGDTDGNLKRQIALESAKSARPDSARVIDSVKIREAWRLPMGSKPGKHAICVDGATLMEEDWTRKSFPFLFLNWGKHSIGFWASGIAAEGRKQQEQVNDTAFRLAERMKICATKRTYYNPAVVKEDQLTQGGESEVLIPVQDMGQRPQEEPVQPASAAEFQWLAANVQKFYEVLGISQMSAQSQKPPGVESGIAMQTLNDIQTVRFLPKARAYETAFVTLGKLCVEAADEIATEHGGYLVKWPGKRFLSEINWSEVSLNEDMYSIRVAPVSQFSRSPAAILELTQQLWSSGIISRETFLQMVQLPDLEEMLTKSTSESEWVEELLGRYLDCVNDEELDKAGGYEAPEPFLMNKPNAMVITVSTYWEAKRDGAPEYCLENIRRYIEGLDELIKVASQPPAQPAPPQAPAVPMNVQPPAAMAPPMAA